MCCVYMCWVVVLLHKTVVKCLWNTGAAWESLYSPPQVDGSWSHQQLEKHVRSRPKAPGVEVAQPNPSRAVSHAERAGLCMYAPINYPLPGNRVFRCPHCLEICCWENINNLPAHRCLVCLSGLAAPWGTGRLGLPAKHIVSTRSDGKARLHADSELKDSHSFFLLLIPV